MRLMEQSIDHTMIALWAALLCIGFVMVASASIPLDADAGSSYHYVIRHSAYIFLGMILVVVFALLPLSILEKLHRPALLIAIVLCVMVLVPGIGLVGGGSRRWINLGVGSIQASEIAKVLLVIYFAGYFAKHGSAITDIKVLSRPIIVTALICILLLLEPDFGTVVIITCVTTGMLFLCGARLRHFVVVGLVGVLLLALLIWVEPYRKDRMISFLDPWSLAQTHGYQLIQALIAFGRGDLFGLGLGEGVQKLFYLPEAHNDFIFAVIAEELGLVGCFFVIALLLLLTLRILKTARFAMQEERYFAAYLSYGAGIIIGMQSFINIGVNTGVLPTKGLTLPFISYGGNSLLVCSVLLGFVLRTGMERHST